MKLLCKDEKWNYQITIEGKDNHGNIVTKVYKTIDIIADTSNNLRGRATRVYEACDIDNPNTKVVIKDSWVAANRPMEGDTLSEILRDASEDEKARFLTVLLHGVVTVHGKQDLTQDLLMNGHLISTDDGLLKESMESYNTPHELAEDMAALDIADREAEDTVQSGPVYKASIFEIFKTSISKTSKLKLNSPPASFITSPDVSTPDPDHQTILQPRVYGPKAHYRIVFKERGESLHSLSRQCQIKLPVVIRAMDDVLEGNGILSCGRS